MNYKNKNGFITVYVLISMIFLITIITVSLINSSRKLKNQSQINSEIHAMYNEEDIENLIIDYTTEIPIYTEEQFTHLKNWINNTKRAKEYMNINGNLYELNPEKYSEYSVNLKTDLYTYGKGGIKINKNNFTIYDEFIEKIKRLYEGKSALEILDVNSYDDSKGCYSLLPIDGEKIEGNEVYILKNARVAIIKIENYKLVVSIDSDGKITKIQELAETKIHNLDNIQREVMLMNPEDFLNEENELLLFDINYSTLIKTNTINVYDKLSFSDAEIKCIMLNEKVKEIKVDFNSIDLDVIIIPEDYKGKITIINGKEYNYPNDKDELELLEINGYKYYTISN